jgi:hypothetical protein
MHDFSWILLIFAIIASIFSILFVLFAWAFGRGERVFYWLAFGSEMYGFASAIAILIFLVALIIFVVMRIYSRLYQARIEDKRRADNAMLLLLGAVIFITFVPMFLFGPSGYWWNRDAEKLNAFTYRLYQYASDIRGPYYYYVYECDQYDYFCTEIYSRAELSIERDVGEIVPGSEKLVSDTASNTLVLEINGEVVYTHHP